MKKKILAIFAIITLTGCISTDKTVIKEKIPRFSPTCVIPQVEEVKDTPMFIPLPGSLLPNPDIE
jgi:hypothetical protein|tara:strand:+ start:158 stop:352 length:195 start_codon:yes stop_codon:yes gene_type:complete